MIHKRVAVVTGLVAGAVAFVAVALEAEPWVASVSRMGVAA